MFAPGASLERAMHAIAAALEVWDQVDLAGECDEAIAHATVAVQALVNRLESHQVALAGALDRREVHRRDGARSGAAWIASRTGIDRGAARQLVHAGRRLPHFPALADAFAAGATSRQHVTAVTSAAVPRRRESLAEHDVTLAELAVRAGPQEMRQAVARIRDHSDPDGSTRPARDRSDPGGPDERRALHVRRTIDGLCDLGGSLLDPVTGEWLLSLLDAFHAPDAVDTPAEERRSPAQTRHDAFHALLTRAAADPSLPTRQRARPQALLLFDLASLFPDGQPPPWTSTAQDGAANDAGHEGGHGGGHEGSHRGGHEDSHRGGHEDSHRGGHEDSHRGGHEDSHAGRPHPPRLARAGAISQQRAARLLWDAQITAVATMGPWRPVSVGRQQRTLPGWLRTVLQLLQPTCRGPDCDLPSRWCEVHHLDAWRDDGETDLLRSIPVCATHHDLIEHAGWRVALDPDTAACRWTSPDGRVLWTYPPPRGPDGA